MRKAYLVQDYLEEKPTPKPIARFWTRRRSSLRYSCLRFALVFRREIVLRLQDHGEKGSTSREMEASDDQSRATTKQKGLLCLEVDVLILSEAQKGRCKSLWVKINIEYTDNPAYVRGGFFVRPSRQVTMEGEWPCLTFTVAESYSGSGRS